MPARMCFVVGWGTTRCAATAATTVSTVARATTACFGNAGNDRLEGGKGRDILDGGTGKDTILARDKAIDTIRCGAGKDIVTADRNDKVAKDCEVVRRS